MNLDPDSEDLNLDDTYDTNGGERTAVDEMETTQAADFATEVNGDADLMDDGAWGPWPNKEVRLLTIIILRCD